MEEVKKIIIVSTKVLFPVVGGERVRLLSLIESIPDSIPIEFLGVSRNPKADIKKFREGLAPKNLSYRLFPFSFDLSLLSVVKSLLDRRPLQVAMFRSRELESYLRAAFRSEELRVIVHLVRGLNFVDSENLGACYLEMTDAISRNYFVLSEKSVFPLSFLFKREAKLLAEFEKVSADRSRRAWLVSERDIDYLVANGVNERRLEYAPLKVMLRGSGDLAEPNLTQPTIAFIGNFTSLQNQEGLTWYLSEVMPELYSRFSVHLKVIGRIGKGLVSEFRDRGYVSFTGEVDDIGVEVKGCFVGICPIRISAGVQTKILEYLAFGLPVISTRRSSESLSLELRRFVLDADTVGENIQRVVALLQKLEGDGSDLKEREERRAVVLREYGGGHLRQVVARLLSNS